MKAHPGKILINPRITEKGAMLAEQGCYIFNVAPAANKQQVVEAIQTTFKVVPRKVTMVMVPRKVVTTRSSNRKGMTAGGKKAYVYLKKGDTIELA